jgi:putative NADPH-quinone reductase
MRILIVVGHPQSNSFCNALGSAYREGAETGGHQATLVALHALSFDPILRNGDHLLQPLEPCLQAAHDALASCDHLVMIFPLWCGDMPALLKGFIERVLQPYLIAHRDTEHAMAQSIFQNKTARVVITMGMPVSIYRFWYRGYALKLLTRNILNFIGIRPVRHTLFGMLGSSKSEQRTRWLADMRALGARAV